MRVLILGGAGMLGHKLWQTLAPRFDTWTAFRAGAAPGAPAGLFDPGRSVCGVTVQDFDSVVGALAAVRPDVVINAVGIVKQLREAHDRLPSITVNALFPHRLASLCRAGGVRLIHVSTDCVFSGRQGNYRERDTPDPVDLYGQTKLLGEVGGPGCLTIRTSIIGWELRGGSGLLEWLARSRGTRVKGFVNAIYSGLATSALAALLAGLIESHPGLSGVYHVSTAPVSKYDLLLLLRRALGWSIEIEPAQEPRCDRSLDSGWFQQATGWHPPTWDTMTAELAAEWATYAQWRGEA